MMVRMKNIALLFLGLLFALTTPVKGEINPEGPLPLRPFDVGIGKRVRDFAFTDLDGKTGTLSEYAGKTLVVAINLIDCPIGRKSIANLEKIKSEFESKGVAFLSLGMKQMDLGELKKEIQARLDVLEHVCHPCMDDAPKSNCSEHCAYLHVHD